MRIVVLDGYVLNPGDLSWDGLRALGETTVYRKTAPEDTVSRIGEAEIVITNKTVLDARVISACPAIRYIGVLATGYNVVDINEAKTRGIVVCNVPAYSTSSVGQMVFALLLDICLHAREHSELVHRGAWAQSGEFSFFAHPLMELAGKTMGILGLGHIGRRVAALADAFEMHVIYHKPSPAPDAPPCARYVSRDELLAKSDVLSLHCPQTPQTAGFICKETIGRMKDGAILINTARGGLVNEHDLADALKSGKLYAAGLDVTCAEPLPNDSPLLSAPNCIITPHIAWAPPEARKRLMNIATDNVRAFLRSEPQNRVG